MADMVTIKVAHNLRRGKTGFFRKGSTVTVTRAEYEQNPGMGELVSGEAEPEVKAPPSVVDLPVQDFDAGNGPMVERLVEREGPEGGEAALATKWNTMQLEEEQELSQAPAKKPRGRRPKAKS